MFVIVSIGAHPMQLDPYEEKYVKVGKSSVDGADEGLFAKVQLDALFFESFKFEF